MSFIVLAGELSRPPPYLIANQSSAPLSISQSGADSGTHLQFLPVEEFRVKRTLKRQILERMAAGCLSMFVLKCLQTEEETKQSYWSRLEGLFFFFFTWQVEDRSGEGRDRLGEGQREKTRGEKSRLTCSPTSGKLTLLAAPTWKSSFTRKNRRGRKKYVTGDRQVSDRARGEELRWVLDEEALVFQI